MNIHQNNPIPQSNQESSSYAPLNSSKTDEIPDQQHRNSYHGSIQQQQLEVHREIRETNNPDPDPLTRTPPFPYPAPLVRYRECLKNHAANMGSHVLDGCGEFMANGEEGTPEALRCAACECHRSFHRREEEGESQSATRTNNAMVVHNPLPRTTVMQPQSHHHSRFNMPPMMVAFGATGVAPTESSSEEMDMFRTHGTQPPSKKRFRTKITEDQKEKMQEFAEKIGWKIQKQCEQEIQQFCNEVGVKRKVFKVWMHNSKQASKKKQEKDLIKLL